MPLYWYNIQNLNMGVYTLRANGSGGFKFGGNAIYFLSRIGPPVQKIVVVTNAPPSQRQVMLDKFSSYLKKIARLEAIQPDPDPPAGLVVIEKSSPSDTLNDTAIQTSQWQDRINTTSPQPAPAEGGIVVANIAMPDERNDAIIKNVDTIQELESIPPLPAPPQGVIVVNRDVSAGETMTEALKRAKALIAELEQEHVMLIIKES